MTSVVVGRVVQQLISSYITGGKGQESPSFVWDKVLKYVSLLGFGLAVIGLGEEHFFAQKFACIIPDTLNRHQYSYIVHWCSRHVRTIDSLPLLILLQNLLIMSPHVLWNLYASAAVQEFYRLSLSLQPFRDPTSGLFPKTTLLIVQHLRNKYTESKTLYRFYFFKLYLQGTLCVTFLAIMLGLYRGGETFYENIWCDFVFSNVSSMNLTANDMKVGCSYPISGAFLQLWIGTLFQAVVGLGAVIAGITWLRLPHWKELDHKERSEFYYSWGLNYGEYNPDKHKYKQSVVVQSDIQLLVMLLFHLNQGRGGLFHDVQVEQNLEERWQDDYEALLKYRNEEEMFAGVTNGLIGNMTVDCEKAPKCHLGLHILSVLSSDAIGRNSKKFESSLHLYCGSKGCTVAVAQCSKETYAIDFNNFFYRSEFENQTGTYVAASPDRKKGNSMPQVTKEQSRMEEDFGAIFHVRVPANIASRVDSESIKFLKRIRHEKTLHDNGFLLMKYDLVVVTCMEPHFRASTGKLYDVNLSSNILCLI
jgi:hypothetical protein